ncbi:polymer-forming cytoskeletal protein [Methanosarcina sp. DH2]|jgi:carbonic anhydrase/acetyltransferase-like protein (isoleucine patch superfamily)|uniref:polymer-forming cytoskeletal protein n=1 Tax=Methanosarcina sp. DH2 TaxID=2605639 RepID=UPI001E37C873|nr:polymer-forming cytoskeletal protein [Methanosarcina sp. DH2]MCC4770763.1 polymer-forming cytoskeletal protein [Methanosarcina sp. DH2]
MMRFIKYHPRSNTYVIEKKVFLEEDVILDGNVIVGQEVKFWKSLTVSGRLELGKGSIVQGNVKAESALVCAAAKILGSMETVSELVLLDGAKVNFAACEGDIRVRPGCSLGSVKAGGTLELVGKVAVKRVEPLTKVIIRAEQ